MSPTTESEALPTSDARTSDVPISTDVPITTDGSKASRAQGIVIALTGMKSSCIHNLDVAVQGGA